MGLKVTGLGDAHARAPRAGFTAVWLRAGGAREEIDAREVEGVVAAPPFCGSPPACRWDGRQGDRARAARAPRGRARGSELGDVAQATRRVRHEVAERGREVTG